MKDSPFLPGNRNDAGPVVLIYLFCINLYINCNLMRPPLVKVFTDPTSSFGIRQNIMPDMYNQLHYHPEIEIACIEAGSGTLFAGQSITQYRAGDIIMIGSNVPHFWKCDSTNDGMAHEPRTQVTVLHFEKNFWGSTFLELQENAYIKLLLEKAGQGISLQGQTRSKVAQLLSQMLEASGSEKIILLLNVLNTIALCSQLSFLSFEKEIPESDDSDRINNVLRYSRSHFSRRIELEEIAAVAFISPNSFCRFFKSKTSKTYSQFLIELRVNHACKLLKENRLNSKQVCCESGFNNFANFHKYFKQITGRSPVQYQKEFKSISLFG